MSDIPYNYRKYIDDVTKMTQRGAISSGEQMQSPSSAGSRGLAKTMQFTNNKTQMQLGQEAIAESMVEIRNIMNRIDGVNVPTNEMNELADNDKMEFTKLLLDMSVMKDRVQALSVDEDAKASAIQSLTNAEEALVALDETAVKEDAGDEAMAKEIAELYDNVLEWITDTENAETDDEAEYGDGYTDTDYNDATDLAKTFREKGMQAGLKLHKELLAKRKGDGFSSFSEWDPLSPETELNYAAKKILARQKESAVQEDDESYGYEWECSNCGTENQFDMTPQERAQYIKDWEADNQDLVADGETGLDALNNLLDTGAESGMHYGQKCIKCGTDATNPYQNEDIGDKGRIALEKAGFDPMKVKEYMAVFNDHGDTSDIDQMNMDKVGLADAMAMVLASHDVENESYQPMPEGDEFDIAEDEDFEEVLGPLGFPEDETELFDAEYQGRKVPLNKPMRGDTKKFKVYVKDPKTGNVKKVNFGHGGTSAKRKTMRIRKSNPKARKSFRARHNCANPGPKTKARYWSCRKW